MSKNTPDIITSSGTSTSSSIPAPRKSQTEYYYIGEGILSKTPVAQKTEAESKSKDIDIKMPSNTNASSASGGAKSISNTMSHSSLLSDLLSSYDESINVRTPPPLVLKKHSNTFKVDMTSPEVISAPSSESQVYGANITRQISPVSPEVIDVNCNDQGSEPTLKISASLERIIYGENNEDNTSIQPATSNNYSISASLECNLPGSPVASCFSYNNNNFAASEKSPGSQISGSAAAVPPDFLKPENNEVNGSSGSSTAGSPDDKTLSASGSLAELSRHIFSSPRNADGESSSGNDLVLRPIEKSENTGNEVNLLDLEKSEVDNERKKGENTINTVHAIPQSTPLTARAQLLEQRRYDRANSRHGQNGTASNVTANEKVLDALKSGGNSLETSVVVGGNLGTNYDEVYDRAWDKGMHNFEMF